jgi:hypothetical protein
MNKLKTQLESFEDVAKILKKTKSSIVSVQVTGNFYKTEDIASILGDISSEDLEIMLFELVYGVYHHQRKYPELRLNFADLSSFILYSRKPSDRTFNYFVNDNHFQVKDTGLKLKFHDLRSSVIHPDIKNNSLSAKQKKYTQEDDLMNMLELFKNAAKGDSKKMIDGLVKDIKKNKYNAESVLLSSGIFSKLKQSTPNVDSSSEQDVASGVDVVNNPLNTSSVGGASDLLDIDDDSHSNSDSSTSSSSSDLLSLGGGNNDEENDDDETELDLDEDDEKDPSDTNTDSLLDLDELSTDVEYSNEKKDKKPKKDFKKNDDENDNDDDEFEDSFEDEEEDNEEISNNEIQVEGKRKLHSGLTEDVEVRDSESSLMSLSLSDVSVQKNNKTQGNKTQENKTQGNRLGDLLGASNVRPPEGRDMPNMMPQNSIAQNSMPNMMPQNSIADVFQQQQFNGNQNDGYNVLSPASIPDVNEGLENEMAKIRQNPMGQMPMNSVQMNQGMPQNAMQQFDQGMPQNMNIQSNLPPYMQQELNQINPNILQGQMNNTQMPMNIGQMPMNSVQMDQGMPQFNQNMPMNMPQFDQGMPMNMGQMPMNMGQQMQGNLPNLNQHQVNDILSKYGPNYNGPIDMIGGSNIVDLEYMLNDNLSSGQKKKN